MSARLKADSTAMDAATLIVIYTLHSGERRIMRQPLVPAAACLEMIRAARAPRLPLGPKVKSRVLYCSPRTVPAAGSEEPNAFLQMTWQFPKGGLGGWWHQYPTVTACHAAAADARKLAEAKGGWRIQYECKTEFSADHVPPTAG